VEGELSMLGLRIRTRLVGMTGSTAAASQLRSSLWAKALEINRAGSSEPTAIGLGLPCSLMLASLEVSELDSEARRASATASRASTGSMKASY